jgi:hypothetical protein
MANYHNNHDMVPYQATPPTLIHTPAGPAFLRADGTVLHADGTVSRPNGSLLLPNGTVSYASTPQTLQTPQGFVNPGLGPFPQQSIGYPGPNPIQHPTRLTYEQAFGPGSNVLAPAGNRAAGFSPHQPLHLNPNIPARHPSEIVAYHPSNPNPDLAGRQPSEFGPHPSYPSQNNFVPLPPGFVANNSLYPAPRLPVPHQSEFAGHHPSNPTPGLPARQPTELVAYHPSNPGTPASPSMYRPDGPRRIVSAPAVARTSEIDSIGRQISRLDDLVVGISRIRDAIHSVTSLPGLAPNHPSNPARPARYSTPPSNRARSTSTGYRGSSTRPQVGRSHFGRGRGGAPSVSYLPPPSLLFFPPRRFSAAIAIRAPPGHQLISEVDTDTPADTAGLSTAEPVPSTAEPVPVPRLISPATIVPQRIFEVDTDTPPGTDVLSTAEPVPAPRLGSPATIERQLMSEVNTLRLPILPTHLTQTPSPCLGFGHRLQ